MKREGERERERECEEQQQRLIRNWWKCALKHIHRTIDIASTNKTNKQTKTSGKGKLMPMESNVYEWKYLWTLQGERERERERDYPIYPYNHELEHRSRIRLHTEHHQRLCSVSLSLSLSLPPLGLFGYFFFGSNRMLFGKCISSFVCPCGLDYFFSFSLFFYFFFLVTLGERERERDTHEVMRPMIRRVND